MLQTEPQDVPDEVLSQLPSQPEPVRAMQRICRKEVLPAPTELISQGNTWQIQENIAR